MQAMTVDPNEVVVFLGPSLAREEARRVLDADYRPPIRRGDITALLKAPRRPKIVGIVDGKFFQSFAISPKEMLPALEQGVILFGSSSMGALRAVELSPFGMRGVGRVFRMFESGELDADDEVAMVYDDETGRAHSVPLVNVRVALEAAREAEVIRREEERSLVAMMKRVYFPERTYRRLLQLGAEEGLLSEERSAALATYLRESAPDAKRDDALELLREVARLTARVAA